MKPKEMRFSTIQKKEMQMPVFVFFFVQETAMITSYDILFLLLQAELCL